MKSTSSNSNIHSFGGINFTDKILKNKKVFDLIDQQLGSRGVMTTYSYSDLFRSYLSLIFCGASCAEDISEHLTDEVGMLKDFKAPSADTLLRMLGELSTKKEVFVSENKISHEFNINPKMNRLMISLAVKTGLLSSREKEYTLDYDNQFIATEKYDSKKSYKKAEGYFPGIASIDNHPVYIEGRNGNSQVKYKQADTLRRVFQNLESRDISIKKARMDCGSFGKEIIDVVEKNTESFYIRAQRSGSLFNRVMDIKQWEQVEVNHKINEIASIEFTPFGGEKPYRYVISRQKKNSNGDNLFTKENYTYRAIITNDRKMSDLDVILFYNARGKSERLFDELNNDFLWKKMPFSFLGQNTTFLIMTAICRNLFHFLNKFVSEKLNFIKPFFRLKKFIFRFIVLPVKWIRRGRQDILKLFTRKEYHLLLE